MAAPSRIPSEFKQRLLEDRDKVARAFIEHLCTYALRRVLTFDDQDDLKHRSRPKRKRTNTGVKDIVRAVAVAVRGWPFESDPQLMSSAKSS
jgi:hypothetical protein